jgi:kynurenine formamidase
MAEYLWNHHLAAVVADNLAVEAMPVDPSAGFLHRRLIPMLGFALGELFALDGLAECCRDTGRYTCFFVAAPLYLPGGVGSPANAVAIT